MSPSFPQTSPDLLRARREYLGLTQEQFHTACMDILRAGTLPAASARSTVSRWENGAAPIPIWMDLVLAIMEGWTP